MKYLEEIEKKLKLTLMYHDYPADLTVENVGRFLHGENWQLAKKPFSEEFYANIAYNGSDSYHAVLWLQATEMLRVKQQFEQDMRCCVKPCNH